jgi:hypothetical protein
VTHLGREALARWRDQPSAEARAEVVDHLARCPDCAARLADLVRDRPVPVTGSPSRFQPAPFVARGLAVRQQAAGPVTRRRATGAAGWSILVGAAAAVVVLALAVRLAPPASPVVTRGRPVLAIVSPIGDVADATEFRWSAPAGASAFRLEILDAGGQLVHEGRVRGSAVTLSDGVAALLVPGEEYSWTVSRLDGHGNLIDTTPPAAFVIRR